MQFKFLKYSFYYSIFSFRKRQLKNYLYNWNLLRKFPISENYEARLLISSMSTAYRGHEKFVLDYFKKSGKTLLELRNSNFNYYSLPFDLADDYQMAIASEFLVEKIYDFSKLKFVPKNIIDCGGYKGYFTWAAIKKFKKSSFICIEPHPANYNSIKDVAKKYDLSNLLIINKAISKSNSRVELCLNGTMSSLYSVDGESIEIETISLNKLVENTNNLLLKVDIEGAELEFFPGIIFALPQRCAVYLETHDSWNSLNSIKKVFLENGFEFQVIRERGLYIDSFAQRI